jgi:phosphate transport system substrate-binding protein
MRVAKGIMALLLSAQPWLATQPALAQFMPRQHLSIVGPAAVSPMAVAAGERFALDTGNATPVVEPVGGAAGIALFCAGIGAQHPDIAANLRRLAPADLAACAANGVSVSELLIGYQAVALAQNPSPAPLVLSRRQLFLALAREVPIEGGLTANPYHLWSDIDLALPVRPIEVLGPSPDTPLHRAFIELVMAEAAGEIPGLAGHEAGALRQDGAFIAFGEDEGTVLGELVRRPGAIGLFSFNHLALRGNGVVAVPLDGVAPSPATIADGRYSAARPVHLYVKRAHAAVPGLKAYLATLLSDAASGPSGFLTDRGLVPLAPAAAAAQRATAESLPPL